MKKDKDYSVPGFLGSAVSAGLKKNGRLDLSLIFSQKEAVAAGVFTTNKVKAAPVLLTQERIRKCFLRAVIANTGYANACTGSRGLNDAIQTADIVAKGLGIHPEETVVASTGVIGAYLPFNLIKVAIPKLIKNLSPNGLKSVAEALMTTDSFPKMSYFEGNAGGHPYHLLGIAKGAGMIMPNMATMLSFLLTDINIDGIAGNKRLNRSAIREFERGLTDVMGELAYMIAKDGEGATKVIIIEVHGAATKDDANTAARAVGNSNLVKTAVFGHDPNWGRIMAALGRSGISMEENKVQIWIDGVKIVEGGVMTTEKEERRAAEKMKNEQLTIAIHLNQGRWKDRITTCDLTYDYIRINADYRT